MYLDDILNNTVENIQDFCESLRQNKPKAFHCSSKKLEQSELDEISKQVLNKLEQCKNNVLHNIHTGTLTQTQYQQIIYYAGGLTFSDNIIEIYRWYWHDEEIKLGEYKNRDKIIEVFSELISKGYYQYLNFSANKLATLDVKQLLGYQNQEELCHKEANYFSLNLSDNKIGPKGAQYIADILKSNKLPHLKILDLSNNPLTTKGCELILEAMQTNTHLEVLNLERTYNVNKESRNDFPISEFLTCMFENEEQTCILKFLLLGDLKKDIKPRTRKHIKNVLRGEKVSIEFLGFNGYVFSKNLANEHQFSLYKHNDPNNSLYDQLIKKYFEFKTKQTEKEISEKSQAIAGDKIEFLARLWKPNCDLQQSIEKLKRATIVNLKNTNLTAKDAEAIAGLLENNVLPCLEKLDLSDNPNITFPGLLLILSALVKNTHLCTADLSNSFNHCLSDIDKQRFEATVIKTIKLIISQKNSKIEVLVLKTGYQFSQTFDTILDKLLQFEDCKIKALSIDKVVFPRSEHNTSMEQITGYKQLSKPNNSSSCKPIAKAFLSNFDHSAPNEFNQLVIAKGRKFHDNKLSKK